MATPPKTTKGKLARLRRTLFPQQRAVFADPARRKSVLVGRRGGKTHVFANLLNEACLTKEGARCLFVSITKDHAQSLLWDHPSMGLSTMNRDLDLGIVFNKTYKRAYYEREDSLIELLGTNKRDEIEKHRGKPVDLAIIDECASIPIRTLRNLIERVVGPGLKDRQGSMIIGGTPGHILSGVFYQATRPDPRNAKPGHDTHRPYALRDHPDFRDQPFVWSSHRWDVRDNIAQPGLWEECLAEKHDRQWPDDHPTWVREYLGEWCPERGLLVFRFDDTRNLWTGDAAIESDSDQGTNYVHTTTPPPPGHKWEHVAGARLEDDGTFSLCVLASAPTHDTLFEVGSYEVEDATVRGMALAYAEARKNHGPISYLVGTGFGNTLVGELAERYDVYISEQDHRRYDDLRRVANTDLSDSRVRFLEGGRTAEQIAVLQYEDDRRLRPDEHCERGLTDAFTFAFEHSEHRYAADPLPLLPPGSPAWWREKMAEEEERVRLELRRGGREGLDSDDYGLEIDKEV